MVTTLHAAARFCLALAALLSINGCVSSRAFLPAEHVTAFNPGGEHYAAEYTLLEGGDSIGEVKVWSEGARRDGSGAPTLVRVGFELKNHGPGPLRLDGARVFLEELPKAGAGRIRAEPLEGDARVPPGESRELHAEFVLPRSVWPSDLPGYRVGWTVVGERDHTRTTPFLRASEQRRGGPWYPSYPGYYYPGWYGSWSLRYRPWPGPWGYRRYYIVP